VAAKGKAANPFGGNPAHLRDPFANPKASRGSRGFCSSVIISIGYNVPVRASSRR